VALPIAIAEVKAIFWFVLFAWSGLATAFAPVIICSLFWKRTTLAGAIAGMAGGFLTTLIWVVFFKAQFYDLYEMLPGFFVGLALTILVSSFTKPPADSAEEFAAIKQEVGEPF
jgi:sodium/proline symporter